jgi:hypothetical protein
MYQDLALFKAALCIEKRDLGKENIGRRFEG